MIDTIQLKDVLTKYKANFASTEWWINEKFKWEAVKCFQDNWNTNAPDFATMLTRSLAKAGPLLASANNFPAKMIQKFAKTSPEEVRAMFVSLLDESVDPVKRIQEFKDKSSALLEKYGNGDKHHFQNENAVSTYLWLCYPEKYYIYRPEYVKTVSAVLGGDHKFKKGAYADNLHNFFALYDEIRAELKKDRELEHLIKSRLDNECHSDDELCTLTIDIGFYINAVYADKGAKPLVELEHNLSDSAEKSCDNIDEEERHYWWLNAKPSIWSFSDIAVGETQNFTLYNDNGHKRRIFKNFIDAKVGDAVIGYESHPVKQIVALACVCAENDGEKLCFKKLEGLSNPIDYQAIKNCAELKNMEFLTNSTGTLFKLTKAEYDFITDMIKEENPPISDNNAEKYDKNAFLDEVYMDESRYDTLVAVLKNKKNIILQGAPGVGKTFAAKRLAYSAMGEKDDSRIEFVQFHQNYSYEDFMMGYRPVDDGFELKHGIFYRFCQKAANRPNEDFFLIIDEINRGNMSKIFGELLMLIERDYRGTKATLAYNGMTFSVPKNLYIIGMMNTADRSLAMIDYALRRRFSFFDIEPGFESDGFKKYQQNLNSERFSLLISKIRELNREIASDKSLGKGFCIGHSYFCGQTECTDEWLRAIVDYDILPMLSEYWFDDPNNLRRWQDILRGVFQ